MSDNNESYYLLWRQHPTTNERLVVGVAHGHAEAERMAAGPFPKWFPEATEWHREIARDGRKYGRTWTALNRKISVEEVERIATLINADDNASPADFYPCTERVRDAVAAGETDADAFPSLESGVADVIADADDLARFCESGVDSEKKADQISRFLLRPLMQDLSDKAEKREGIVFVAYDEDGDDPSPPIALNGVALARLIRLVRGENQ